jgi:hypothetical protein
MDTKRKANSPITIKPGALVPRILRSENGMALAITIILLLSLAAMALTATLVGSTDLLVAGNQRMNSAALDVAEAGVAEALNRMSLAPGTTVPVGGNMVDASIADPAYPPNPNWKAHIFLTPLGASPAAPAGEFSTGTVQTAGNYLEYSDPADINEAVLIQHKTRDFNGDGIQEVVLYDPALIPPENPTSGSPVELVTVTGHQGTAKRSVQVEAIRFPIHPNVTAALSADATVDLRGNVTVCGHNHRIDTPVGRQLPLCSPNWDEPMGHLPAVMTTGDAIDTRGSTDLLGSPAVTDTAATNHFYSLSEALGVTQSELKDILSSPDQTTDSEAGPYEGITYIQGDAEFNGINGQGLLYVTGDLKLAGNFSWKGLVYVEGKLVNTGNTWILGGVMARGDLSVAVDFGAGTPVILYSREALIQALTLSMRYVTLGWKEMD